MTKTQFVDNLFHSVVPNSNATKPCPTLAGHLGAIYDRVKEWRLYSDPADEKADRELNRKEGSALRRSWSKLLSRFILKQ